MCGESVPAVRIRKLLHQFSGVRFPERRLEIAAPQRVIRNNAPQAAHCVAVIKINALTNFFRNGNRRLDHLPVNIGYVQIAVRSVREIARPEPDILGGEELDFVLRAMREKRSSVGLKDVAVYQVSTDIAGENVAHI